MITITLDAATNGSFVTGSTSMTYAHTVAGLNRLLVVGVSAGASDIVTGVTYNGVAMTRINVRNNGNSTAYLYYLIAPATGTHNVVVSTSAPATIVSDAVSFNGVGTIQPEASVTNTASATNACANTLTTIADGSVHLATFAIDSVGMSSVTNGTLFGNILAYSPTISPAAAHTMTGNSPGNNAWATVGASFSPALPSSGMMGSSEI